MITIEEFVEARLRETEIKFEGLRMSIERTMDIQMMFSNMYDLLTMHKNWPVMVLSEPDYTFDTSSDNIVYRMSQKIVWATQEEYRKKFGSEPPTAPMVARMAEMWKQHPDFNQEWLSERSSRNQQVWRTE